MPNSGQSSTKHNPAAKHNPATPPAQKPVHVNAFGVEFDVADKSKAESAGMSKGAKAALQLGALGVVLAIVVWWQFFRNPIDDTDAANPQVREVIQSEQKKDAAKFMQLAQSSDPVVARRAVTSLGTIGHMDGVNTALSDNRAEVRGAAISTMSASANPAYLPTLTTKMKQDPSPDNRIAAMRGVANSQDFAVFDSLIEMLSDQDKHVRAAAIGAIEEKLSIRFREYDPKNPSPAAINKIKQTIPRYRDLYNDYVNRKRGG